MKISTRLLFSLLVMGSYASVLESQAHAQQPNNNLQNNLQRTQAIPIITRYTRPQVLAFLLDPQNNRKPAPFAPWPGLPIEQDLSPQAAALFDDSPPFNFVLPEGVRGVTPNDNGNGLIAWVMPAAVGNVAQLAAFIASVDIPNPSLSTQAELVSFTGDLPKPFADLVKGWDGKTAEFKTFAADELTDDDLKVEGVSIVNIGNQTLTSTKPKDVRAKTTDFPQTFFRFTGVVALQDNPRLINDDSPVGLVIESGDELWDPVVAPDAGVGTTTVIALPNAEGAKNPEGRVNFLLVSVSHVGAATQQGQTQNQ